jgi:hypothetical protein
MRQNRKLTPQEIWRKKNPKKHWAHRATRSAIRSGLIERQPCEVCGDPQTDAHHPDYDRPLKVQWLCRKHHKLAHKKGEV